MTTQHTKRKAAPTRRIELSIDSGEGLASLVPAIPDDIEFTIKMPGLERAIEMIVTAALAQAEKLADRADDPLAPERLALEIERQSLDADRQKLAWEEFRLRRAEFDANERDRAERREIERLRAAKPL